MPIFFGRSLFFRLHFLEKEFQLFFKLKFEKIRSIVTYFTGPSQPSYELVSEQMEDNVELRSRNRAGPSGFLNNGFVDDSKNYVDHKVQSNDTIQKIGLFYSVPVRLFVVFLVFRVI